MSRPGSHRADVIDAIASAVGGVAWQRTFSLSELDRLRKAGALSGTHIDLTLRSAQRDGCIELEGELGGELMLPCQRCLEPARFELREPISLRVVRDEQHAQEPGEHEYLIADPIRLDLRWLSEEQALLAMPLVPMHEIDACPQGHAVSAEDDEEEQSIAPSVTQSPFANLRDMLKKKG